MEDEAVLRKRSELLDKINDRILKLKEEIHRKRGCQNLQRDSMCGTQPCPRQIPHPYLPYTQLEARPKLDKTPPKVTVDGRLADPYADQEFYFEEPPLGVPPWFRPRYNSFELRAGFMMLGCDCRKRNGLQDDCPRWDCGGRPECLLPCPKCGPGTIAPRIGLRQENAYTKPTPLDARLKEAEKSNLGYSQEPMPYAVCPVHSKVY